MACLGRQDNFDSSCCYHTGKPLTTLLEDFSRSFLGHWVQGNQFTHHIPSTGFARILKPLKMRSG